MWKFLSCLCQDLIYFKRNPALPGGSKDASTSYKLKIAFTKNDCTRTIPCIAPSCFSYKQPLRGCSYEKRDGMKIGTRNFFSTLRDFLYEKRDGIKNGTGRFLSQHQAGQLKIQFLKMALTNINNVHTSNYSPQKQSR